MSIETIVIIYSYFVGIGAAFYFLWFLSWPCVAGKVVSVGINHHEMAFSGTRKFSIASFQYDFMGQNYHASRQGIYLKQGFAKNFKVGDDVQIRHCKVFPSLSCPNKTAFNFICTMLIIALCLLTIVTIKIISI